MPWQGLPHPRAADLDRAGEACNGAGDVERGRHAGEFGREGHPELSERRLRRLVGRHRRHFGVEAVGAGDDAVGKDQIVDVAG